MGASVLQGYELLGESFVVGSNYVIEAYSNILNIDSNLESAKKKLNNYLSDTQGGSKYVSQTASALFSNKITNQISALYDLFITNVGMNLFAMQTTVSGISENLLSNSVSLFHFNLESKKEIRPIKLNQ
jgi:hypothetical protein